MGIFRRESTWEKLSKPLGRVDGRSVARSGLTAAATVVALSLVSSLASAIRRRQDGQ